MLFTSMYGVIFSLLCGMKRRAKLRVYGAAISLYEEACSFLEMHRAPASKSVQIHFLSAFISQPNHAILVLKINVLDR
jgi:hypothetical protein